jgi:nucleoside-diphosphate-sugar epimerase
MPRQEIRKGFAIGMPNSNIAIFGATSHIAKGLIHNFLRSGGFRLDLYTGSPDSGRQFLDSLHRSPIKSCVIHEGYADLLENSHDVIINCAGVGTLKKLNGNYAAYFTVTEKFDNLAIQYLCETNPEALYISFSSGAVYGRNHAAPVDEDSANPFKVNQILPEDYYAIARLNAESKHRAFSSLRIIDLRVFSYFSRFIDLTEGYFISEVVSSILKSEIFVTDPVDMVRDYVHPDDLFGMILKCLQAGKINAAFDAVSAKPVTKMEVLDSFSSEFGLQFKITQSPSPPSATGPKPIYCSNYNAAARIGHRPKFRSMDALIDEAGHILSKGKNTLKPKRRDRNSSHAQKPHHK